MPRKLPHAPQLEKQKANRERGAGDLFIQLPRFKAELTWFRQPLEAEETLTGNFRSESPIATHQKNRRPPSDGRLRD